MGKGISQFKQGMNDAVSEIKDNTTDNSDKCAAEK